ncbi:hypothetical protein [Jiangella alba]|nr:hypothetical protein [Jiangella alba]
MFFGIQGDQIVPQVYADCLAIWAAWQDLAERAHRLTSGRRWLPPFWR